MSLKTLINQESDLEVCGEAEDAKSASRSIGSANPDLVVLDISLNASSGFDLLRTLKNKHPKLGMLVFSMHDEKLYAERCIRAGALGYVMKRESSDKILNSMRMALNGNISVSDQIAAIFAKKLIGRQTSKDADALSSLSDRELEIFNLIDRGFNTRSISVALGVNMKTIQTHCANIKDKLGLNSATELLREATKWHDESSSF